MNRESASRCFDTRLWPTLAIALLVAMASLTIGARPMAAAGQSRGSAAAVPAQTSYATPEVALAALVSAVEAKDRPTLDRLFGPESAQLFSGDVVEDNRDLQHFGAGLRTSAKLQKDTNGGYTILVGEKQWPFPIPIVSYEGRWRFDTKAGLNEILNRRIGENELSAIATCRAYVVAQWEYYTQSGADHDGLAVYARRFISSPGTRDGLYWPTGPDEKPSPFGDLIMARRAEGYGPRSGKRNYPRTEPKPKFALPYHGYYFRILTRQGPSAPGGKFDYVINGNMIAGYALVAYPAKWGSSGVMTFIVNQQGRVYQKNLGPDIGKAVEAMTGYNPDPSWQLVDSEP